jgi:hypothetical protein
MGSKRLSIIVGGREPIMAMIGQLVAIFSANKHPLTLDAASTRLHGFVTVYPLHRYRSSISDLDYVVLGRTDLTG